MQIFLCLDTQRTEKNYKALHRVSAIIAPPVSNPQNAPLMSAIVSPEAATRKAMTAASRSAGSLTVCSKAEAKAPKSASATTALINTGGNRADQRGCRTGPKAKQHTCYTGIGG